MDFVFLASSSGLHETLALLTSQLRPDSNHREEMGFLRDVFSEKSLSYLMKVRACSASFPVPRPREALPWVAPAISLHCEGFELTRHGFPYTRLWRGPSLWP